MLHMLINSFTYQQVSDNSSDSLFDDDQLLECSVS